jgi:hypothetical protein
MGNLGLALSDEEQYPEAEKVFRETLATKTKKLGAEHRSTLVTAGNLANVLCHEGKYAEAEQLSRQSLAIEERTLGKDHSDTLVSKACWARCWARKDTTRKRNEYYVKTTTVCCASLERITRTPPSPRTIWPFCMLLKGKKGRPASQSALCLNGDCSVWIAGIRPHCANRLLWLYYLKGQSRFGRDLRFLLAGGRSTGCSSAGAGPRANGCALAASKYSAQ